MIIADVMTILFVLGIMFYYDLQLAAVTLAPIPVMMFCTYLFQKKVRKASEKVRVQVSNLNTLLQEYLSGIQLIKIFSRLQTDFLSQSKERFYIFVVFGCPVKFFKKQQKNL